MRANVFTPSIAFGRWWVVLLLLIPSLCKAQIYWQPPWRVSVNGQAMEVEMFTSRWSPDVVLRALAHGKRSFDRYVVTDGRILLSGTSDGVHWLAEIQSHAEGTHGYVSALYFGRQPEAVVGRSSYVSTGTGRRHFEFGPSATVSLDLNADSTEAVSVSVSER